MHSILVVFVILLAILMLISALGGSLNLQEKFEEEEHQNTMAEMFYEEPMQEEKTTSPSLPTPTVESPPSPIPMPKQPSVESFTDGKEVEPFEEDDMKYGSPL